MKDCDNNVVISAQCQILIFFAGGRRRTVPPLASAEAKADATMRTARASLAERLNTDTDTATQKLAKAQAMVRSKIARKRFMAHIRAERRKELPWTTLDGCFHHSPCLERLKQRLRRYAPGYISNYERVGESADDDEIHGMAKMSRLSTDLANERTLLAWTRTVLAALRTSLALLKFDGVDAFWVVVRYLSTFMMTSVMVSTCLIGIYRYYKIKRIVHMKNIPYFFGRAPIWPMPTLVALSVGAIALALFLQGFEPES